MGAIFDKPGMVIDEFFDKPGNLTTGESFTGAKRDFFKLYLASLKKIPPMSAAEEADCFARWERFEDGKARERVIEAHLRLVPPIAISQARKFGSGMEAEDLFDAGSEGLVLAFDGYAQLDTRLKRFESYAAKSIYSAVKRAAVSLLSIVDHPWGKRVKDDLGIDPAKNDIIGKEEDIGCRQARPVEDDIKEEDYDPDYAAGVKAFSAQTWMREITKEPLVLSQASREGLEPLPLSGTRRSLDEINLPWILEARLDGMKLKDIAKELGGVSIPTAHRRVKAAMNEVRLCLNN